jgi:hypothetical protein
MVMDPSINTTNFTLKQGTTAITGVVTYSGTTASFKPTNALVEIKTYTATITTAAKNAAGYLANNYVWNFTTLSALVVPAPSGLFFGVLEEMQE